MKITYNKNAANDFDRTDRIKYFVYALYFKKESYTYL